MDSHTIVRIIQRLCVFHLFTIVYIDQYLFTSGFISVSVWIKKYNFTKHFKQRLIVLSVKQIESKTSARVQRTILC